MNCAGILANQPDVLNGIAYDPQTNRLWITGKLWPRLFQVLWQLNSLYCNLMRFWLVQKDSLITHNATAMNPLNQAL